MPSRSSDRWEVHIFRGRGPVHTIDRFTVLRRKTWVHERRFSPNDHVSLTKPLASYRIDDHYRRAVIVPALRTGTIIAVGELRGTPTLRCLNHAGMVTGVHRDIFWVSRRSGRAYPSLVVPWLITGFRSLNLRELGNRLTITSGHWFVANGRTSGHEPTIFFQFSEHGHTWFAVEKARAEPA